MIRNSGHTDLPLHSGTVPRWLADRMMVLGTLITQSIVENFGANEVLTRLSDPLWFQSFGAVLGMDWHSSGITTSVMYALKRGLNPRAKELGIYVCGGRGKYSRLTPNELLEISEKENLNGDELVKNSRLVAKVDNNALQDGFQLYQHNFILTKDGSWTVIQQGMNVGEKKARRYHWCSTNLRSFVEQPHTGIVGENLGKILNLTDTAADRTRNSILEMSREEPERVLKEILQIEKPAGEILLMQNGKAEKLNSKKASKSILTEDENSNEKYFVQGELFPELEANENFVGFENSRKRQNLSCKNNLSEKNLIQVCGRSISMPLHHEVLEQDVDLKRLGGVLGTAYESQPKDFEELLLTPGLGPRTLQSLALVSEVIYGTPSRFTDPARFSFAHGGKDAHPFPVPLKIYDESIRILHESIEKSKLGYKDKSDCIRRLHATAMNIENKCSPEVDFNATIEYEKAHSKKWDGRSV